MGGAPVPRWIGRKAAERRGVIDMIGRTGLAVFCCTLWMAAACHAEDTDNKFVGVGKCKNCHAEPAKGDQYNNWLKEKHAKAYETLASEAAKKTAKERGIEDPQKSAECLQCHVTAYGVAAEQKHKKFDETQGVQCESCHGPGDKHVKARLAGEDPPADKPLKVGEGEINRTPGAETCKKCHNEKSPNYKPFCYKKFAKEIAHLDPRRGHAADHFDKLECDCEECKKAGK